MMKYFDYPAPFFTCAAGFSAVLFALKVVVNRLDPNALGNIMGLPIEVRYLAWAELALVSLMFPGSSFLGHLCGIAMGYAYIYGLLNPIFGTLNYIKDIFNQPAVHTYRAQPTTTFNYANSTGYNNTYTATNPRANNMTNNHTNTSANTNHPTNHDTNAEGYSSLGEGFYNRYRNYDYNQQGDGATQRPRNSGNSGNSSGSSATRARTVVNGWTESSSY